MMAMAAAQGLAGIGQGVSNYFAQQYQTQMQNDYLDKIQQNSMARLESQQKFSAQQLQQQFENQQQLIKTKAALEGYTAPSSVFARSTTSGLGYNDQGELVTPNNAAFNNLYGNFVRANRMSDKETQKFESHDMSVGPSNESPVLTDKIPRNYESDINTNLNGQSLPKTSDNSPDLINFEDNSEFIPNETDA